jgi:hypothetical protein
MSTAAPRRASAARVRSLAVLVLYAVAMGWLEGVVVVYIRGLLGISSTEPLPPGEEVLRRLRTIPWLLGAEQSRELATIVMLAAVAWLAGARGRERLGAFLVAFGVWDIAYYVTLYALLRWPPSLGTMDLLFLIPPHPWWSQPVWVPVAISAAMIALGGRLPLGPRRRGGFVVGPRAHAVIAALAMSAATAAPAFAGVPSAATSIVDPCLRVCPGGDMTFHVAVKDNTGSPVPGAVVTIDLCGCGGVVFCPLAGTEPYVLQSGCTVAMLANQAGIADFPIRAGGVCRDVPIGVRADGVTLATLFAVASPDQTGDSIANATDRNVLLAKLAGPYDPTCDFNCGGYLDDGDRAIFETHVDVVHWCEVVVPAREPTWGSLKTLYR